MDSKVEVLMSFGVKFEIWEDLLRQIKGGKFTPFIGAGASYPYLPLAGELAYKLSLQYGYPLDDKSNLSKVAQFMALDHDDMLFPKRVIAREFGNIPPPDLSLMEFENSAYSILADLNLPLYITTNYDNFMFNALKSRKKSPERELCRWDQRLAAYLKALGIEEVLGSSYKPSPDRPLVYHLHGSLEIPQSMVLTEDDYLDFLVRLQKIDEILPRDITIALSTNTLIFIGYSLADWNFRVLMRSLFRYGRVLIQVRPGDFGDNRDRALKYLDRYFRHLFGGSSERTTVGVYWGDVADFARELRYRLERS